MLISTKEFKGVASAILIAVDENAANLELLAKGDVLRLSVTNREYYVSKLFHLAEPTDFHAVVDAHVFLGLISSITSESFDLTAKDGVVFIKAGKSKYKTPMIYENESLAALPFITVKNATVSMNISKEVLQSILNVNSKELLKVKNIDVNPLQKLYYIDETGCFTFTTGATLNKFALEKPIKLLLNDRVVKLFKLFESDATLTYGADASADGSVQTKVVFSTPDTYVAAIVNSDDVLLNDVQRPCAATKSYIEDTYANHLVVSSNELSAAVNRLMQFTKNALSNQNMRNVPAKVSLSDAEMTITDNLDNSEAISIEAGSYVDSTYTMIINLADLKLVLDSCKNEHLTINCGNHRSIIINRGQITNLLPESRSI